MLIVTVAAFCAVFSVVTPVHADTTITSNISATTTWSTSGGVYIIQNNISVNSGVTLTIDPGTIVKFEANTSLTVNGTLSAVGTATSSVYLTSIKDDVGGDTNGDGTATSPAAGNWVGIIVSSGASTTINHAVVGYTGQYPAYANVKNDGGILNIFNSEIATSSTYGIYHVSGTTTIESSYIHNNTYYGINAQGSGQLTLTDNTFANNPYTPAYIALSSGLILTSSGNSATGTGKKGYLIAPGTVETSQTWLHDGIPYVISGGTLTIPSGKSLTINPRTIVKIDTSSGITVNGTLNAVATSSSDSIFFTSYKDDTQGGDTNNDNASSGASGDWNGIILNTGAVADFGFAVVRYGGGSSNSMIRNDGGSLHISSSTVAYNAYIGITNTAGTTTIQASDIAYSTYYGLYVTGGSASVTASSTLHNNPYYSILNTTNASTSAVGNYWGDPAGPYNATYNSTGTTTSSVSDHVTFDPWVGKGSASTTLHYIELNCPSSTCGSVRNQIILLQSTSGYVSEVNLATSTWNILSNNMIVPATSSPTLTMSDTYAPDMAWKGGYSTTTPGTILLNTYFLDSNTSSQRQNTIEHELGHAFGLNHSFTGNVMYFAQSSQTSFGLQDIADFNYLWP